MICEEHILLESLSILKKREKRQTQTGENKKKFKAEVKSNFKRAFADIWLIFIQQIGFRLKLGDAEVLKDIPKWFFFFSFSKVVNHMIWNFMLCFG